MRLLLINFEMNEASPVLAWQAALAFELAQKLEHVTVLTERLGSYKTAPNMSVHVMPRWPWGVPKRFGGGFFVNWQLARILKREKCDVCFIHMAHTWAYRLAPTLKWYGLPTLLWYAHGSVTRSLHWALACVQRVVTSTPEGFRIETPKRHIIGQAIDTQLFKVPARRELKPEIVYIGRISARKRVQLMLEAFAQLRAQQPDTPWKLKLVGPSLTAQDHSYMHDLLTQVALLGLANDVEFCGPMEQAQTPALYETAALHLNLSETGSMDKTVMEALACGCPVLTTNIAFRETLAKQPDMFTQDHSPAHIASRIQTLYAMRHTIAAADLRALVVGQHDLQGFTAKIVRQLEELALGE